MRIVLALVLILFLVGLVLASKPLKVRAKEVLSQFKAVHFAWSILFFAILNFGKIESSSILISNSRQILLVIVSSIVIGLSLTARFRQAFSAFNLPLFFLFIYAFAGILSGAISPYPVFTIYKAVLIIISGAACMLFLSYMPRYDSACNALDLTLYFYWILFLSFLLGGIISPEKAFSYYREGMFFEMIGGWIINTNSNALAMIAGVVALVCINRSMSSRPIKDKLFYIFALPSVVAVLILAQSRTCIVAFVVSIPLILFKKNIKYIFSISLIIIILIGALGIKTITEDTAQYVKRGQTDLQFETWSGRLPVWQYSWEKFKERPLIGYGMAAGVRYGSVSELLLELHLHSSYFEVLLNTGLIGFIPWIICLFLIMLRVFRRYIFMPASYNYEMKERHIEITAMVTFLIIRSIAATIFVVFDHSFMLYTALIAYAVSIGEEYLNSTSKEKTPGMELNYGSSD